MKLALAGMHHRPITIEFLGPEPEEDMVTLVRVMHLVILSLKFGLLSGGRVRDDATGLDFCWRYQ